MEVWQLARILVREVYEITQKPEFQKDFSLKNQVRRCAVSIMANISEGFERKTQKEFIQFLFIAKGSCGELRSHFYIAFDLEYINKEFSTIFKIKLLQSQNQSAVSSNIFLIQPLPSDDKSLIFNL